MAAVVRDAQIPALCQEHFQVPGSAHVLHLHQVFVRARPEHTPVQSPPPSLTPTPRRIVLELQSSLGDWQSSPSRSYRRASWLASMSGSRTEHLNEEQKSACSVCLLQTILRPENQKELFLKACGQELNLEGIMKEERLCLECQGGGKLRVRLVQD